MATKKRATAKKSVKSKQRGSPRTLAVKGTVVDRDIPAIGGDDATIELEYVVPSDLSLTYADNLNIIHTPTEFVLSFLQTQPPLVRKNEDWDKIKTIESRCVVRVVVSPLKMQDMVQTIIMNWQRYVQKYFKDEGEDATGSDAQASGNGK